MWDIEAAFEALPLDNASCNKYLIVKPEYKYYNAFTYWAFMEMYDLYSSREVKLLIVDALSYHYNTLVLAVGDECFFVT